MTTIRIAGVPEHFNLPWHIANESGAFSSAGIDLKWTSIPEGTGKMCRMLRDNETDVAVILTEGIIKDIIDGNPSRIVQVYVDSPLIWGIHVDANSAYQSVEDIEGKTAAISRFGSGSHLMAFVNAANQNWDTANLRFEVVNTIDGAVEALAAGRADYFMWERFMTKPLVDQGIFRRIGDCPTPWPCFVIAVRNEFMALNEDAVRKMLGTISDVTKNFKSTTGIEQRIASEFNQKQDDIREWLSLTEWSQSNLSEDLLNKVQNQLYDLRLVAKKATFTDIVHA